MKVRYFAMIVLLLAALLTLSWLRVDGSELPQIENLSQRYTASVHKNPASANDWHTQEYTLSGQQIIALKEALLDSRFTRHLSNSYTYSGLHDTYSIVLELRNDVDKQVDFIQIFFVEDLYFSIDTPYSGEHMLLKVRNDQLDEILDQIILGK